MVALLLGLLMANSRVLAECDGTHVIFQDNFAAGSSNWWLGGNTSIGGGKMIIPVSPGTASVMAEYDGKNVLFNTDPRPTKICADFRFPAQTQDAVEAGILFWSIRDRRNVLDAYLWVITNTGWASLKRINGDQWSVIFSAQTSDIKAGANALNGLQVTVDRDAVSFFVNGAIERSVRDIFQPTGATRYGVGGFLLQPLRADATIEVTTFKVTTPYAP